MPQSSPYFHAHNLRKYSSPIYRQATAVDKEVPLDVDTGLLTVTDLNPIDAETYAYVLHPAISIHVFTSILPFLPT